MYNKISFLSKLLATLPASVFESFMYCPFVLSKISLWVYLMFALPACSAILCSTRVIFDGRIACKEIKLLHVQSSWVLLSLTYVILDGHRYHNYTLHPCSVMKIQDFIEFNLIFTMVTREILSILLRDWFVSHWSSWWSLGISLRTCISFRHQLIFIFHSNSD